MHVDTDLYEKDGPIDDPNNLLRWEKYHTISINCFIQHLPGDERFQLITDKLVYFYVFEENEDGSEPDYIPKLESVMLNFMQCTNLLVETSQNLAISFKNGQPNFEII